MSIRQKLFWKLYARKSKWAFVFSGNPHFSSKFIKFLASIISDRK